MGLLMYFFVEPGVRPDAATPAGWVGLLNDPSAIADKADFSLHLSPVDLDILVEQIRPTSKGADSSLTESLAHHVAGDANTWSVDALSASLVGAIAAVSPHRIEDIVRRWEQEVALEHREEFTGPSLEARRAVHDLIRVCQESRRVGRPVLHAWFL